MIMDLWGAFPFGIRCERQLLSSFLAGSAFDRSLGHLPAPVGSGCMIPSQFFCGGRRSATAQVPPLLLAPLVLLPVGDI